MAKYYIKGITFDGVNIVESGIEELIYQEEMWYTTDGDLAFPKKPSGIWAFNIEKMDLHLVDPTNEYLNFNYAYYIIGKEKELQYLDLGFVLGIEFSEHEQKERCLLN